MNLAEKWDIISVKMWIFASSVLRNKVFTLLIWVLFAVSLVDSFDIHDQSLLSTLGAYDGQVYKRMFESALESPLNKTDVSPAYQKYIKPILKSSL